MFKTSKLKLTARLVMALAIQSSALTLYPQAPFSRGVNLTGWFQAASAGQVQFTRFTRNDIASIKSLGCDAIRLPVNMHGMTSGSPLYTFEPLFFSFLDSVVTWCEQSEVYLILDNHSYDPSGSTSPGTGTILVKVWTQIAQRYKDRSKYVLYEILNEPNGISTTEWGPIQNQAVNAIRAYDTKHTIIIGGSGYNTYSELRNLPVYADTNLLYTFHFYDPFLFTHQGATWVSPSMASLAGVPFPFCGSCMPVLPPSLQGSWIGTSYNNYSAEGRVSYVQSLIDKAIEFRNSRHVNIFCGEFGVYIPNSDPDDRAYWYQIVREYLEANKIPWTIWDYKGGFGLFNKGSAEIFEHDLNIPLLRSLGLDIPPQTPFIMKPDSAGFPVYSDFIEEKINDASYTSGRIDFYSPDLPNNGSYCLSWNNFNQYNAIGFDFQPDRDLSRLVAEGFAIDFMVRSDIPGTKFDIRFMDTKSSDPGDHPWRMGATIGEDLTVGDRRWHHVYIPLSELNERGAWDNNTWYNPSGSFDWKSVDRFEISTEYPPMTGWKIWFDNIHLTNRDTALVRETDPLGIDNIGYEKDRVLKIAPNPMKSYTVISYNLEHETPVTLSIFSISGEKIISLVNNIQPPGEKSEIWTGINENGASVSKGIYLVRIMANGYNSSEKIIKN